MSLNKEFAMLSPKNHSLHKHQKVTAITTVIFINSFKLNVKKETVKKEIYYIDILLTKKKANLIHVLKIERTAIHSWR